MDYPVKIFPTINELSVNLSGEISRIIRQTEETGQPVSIALSGGNSPVTVFQRLVREKIHWNNVHLFQVDERFVSREHNDNNFRMIKETLLNNIDIPPKNIHPINILATPDETAEEYSRSLSNYFTKTQSVKPVFDIILLGIGNDGHTASLFPENNNLFNSPHTVLVTETQSVSHSRISLSLSVINNAKNIYFLVAGSSKAGIIERILVDNDLSLPAALVKPQNGSLNFFLDKEAASLLKL